jgi:hypothetical protein
MPREADPADRVQERRRVAVHRAWLTVALVRVSLSRHPPIGKES